MVSGRGRARVDGAVADSTDGAAREVTVGYDVEAYENTCRPTAPVCQGCVFGTSCANDGGSHTEPHFTNSVLLIGYR
jgi:hypothetical protein